jgi:hypothetical protein
MKIYQLFINILLGAFAAYVLMDLYYVKHSGLRGPQGPQGERGIQGVQGFRGAKGDQGLSGILVLNKLHAYHTLTQTTVGAENIPVRFNTFEASKSLGFTIVNDGSGNPTRLTAASAGIYDIQTIMQVHKKSGGGTHQLYSWFRINGTDEPYSNQTVTLENNGDFVVMSCNEVVTLASGQYVEVMWRANDASLELLKNTTVPGIPEIPSASITIVQVG